MKFVLHTGGATYRIHAYSNGAVVVNEHTFTSSLILTPERIIADWPPSSIDLLSDEHVDAVLALGPQVVLLGTGENIVFPNEARLRHLALSGVGFEVMSTPAACRTYNVLMSEGREVAAALILPQGS